VPAANILNAGDTPAATVKFTCLGHPVRWHRDARI